MSDSRPRDLTPEELASTQSPAIPQGTAPALPPPEEKAPIASPQTSPQEIQEFPDA
jgi:hypothetical protein